MPRDECLETQACSFLLPLGLFALVVGSEWFSAAQRFHFETREEDTVQPVLLECLGGDWNDRLDQLVHRIRIGANLLLSM